MADISYWGDEYKREVEQFRTLVNHLTSLRDSLNSRAINQAINDCDSKVNRLKEVKKSFGLELRLVKDKAVKSEYDNIMKDLDNNVATLTQEFKDMKTKHSKSELLQGSNSSNNPYSTEGKDNDSLLEGASLLQDKTAESLVRSKQLIETSKEVGSSTIDELKRQREQIKEIETQVDTIESSILRAERLVLNFGRRMATDKIIQGFAAINIVVMLGLILYVAISGKSLAKQARTSKYFEPFLGASPTPKPSRYPTVTPTYFPTAIPTVSPTLIPTYHPTITFAPSFIPSGHPTSVPSSPSSQPSSQPTSRPTERPSSNPISYPTSQPTNYPTSQPSSQPTTQPTVQPTVQPTSWPTSQPTGQPTSYPTFFPTSYPSGRPTSQPSVLPSSQPSASPTTSSPTPLPT